MNKKWFKYLGGILITVSLFNSCRQKGNENESMEQNNLITAISMKTDDKKFVQKGWETDSNGEKVAGSTFKYVVATPDNDIEEGFEFGVSGMYTGVVDGEFIQAGGCNFPINPMGKDSKKRFYKGIYRLSSEGNCVWSAVKIGELPAEMAYGLGFPIENGMLLIGGTTAEKSVGNVYLLTLDSNGKAQLEDYPSLPEPIDNHGVSRVENLVFAGGGNLSGQPSNKVFMLDMNDLGKGWTELPAFPGNPRVQPVMAAVKNQAGEEVLYLWGGFAGKTEGREATLNTDGVKYNVRNGYWETVEGPRVAGGEEVSTGGGAAVVLPDGRVVVTGGVNKDIFLGALRNQPADYLDYPIGQYKFNDHIFIFNPHTEKWEFGGKTQETARAGAGIVATGNGEILVTGGELKPRIRTSDIYKLKI